MRLDKRKFSTKLRKVIINSVVILAILSNFSTPLVVKGKIDRDVANVSQNITFSDQFLAKGPLLIKAASSDIWHLNLNREKPNKVVKAVITAYTSTPDQTDDSPFIAASGKRVHDGMIAANFLPFGTRVKIPSIYGEKIFIVEDRMNSRYGYGRLDVWLDTTKAEARKFGVKRVEIEIFYPEKVIAKAGK
jgi:3D (Asp-Asp-Asp) domain-containing protein